MVTTLHHAIIPSGAGGAAPYPSAQAELRPAVPPRAARTRPGPRSPPRPGSSPRLPAAHPRVAVASSRRAAPVGIPTARGLCRLATAQDAALRPQLPHVPSHAQRDVYRVALGESDAPPVGDPGAHRLGPSRARTEATPPHLVEMHLYGTTACHLNRADLSHE